MRPSLGMLRPLLCCGILFFCGCRTEEAPGGTRLRTEVVEPAAQEPVGATPRQPVLPVLDEWSIRIEQESIPSGRTEFFAINQGRVTHALVIEGQGRQWRTRDIPPGAEGRIAADLEPGTYAVYCPIEDEHGNHAELGMRTVLEVR